jgi:hypothetical protein
MALAIVAMSNIIGGKLAQNKEMFDNCDGVVCGPDNQHTECCCHGGGCMQ